MKKIVSIIFCLSLFLPFACFAETSGWIGGFSIASEGFISNEITDDAEYLGVNLFVEPWSFPILTPSFSAGIVFPIVPLNISSGLLTAEVGFELFAMHEHPFSWIIDLENYYCPLVSFRVMAPFSSIQPDSWYLSAVLSPFRLKTGSGRFSIMSLSYIADSELSYVGWGVKMFDFRLFLY